MTALGEDSMKGFIHICGHSNSSPRYSIISQTLLCI